MFNKSDNIAFARRKVFSSPNVAYNLVFETPLEGNFAMRTIVASVILNAPSVQKSILPSQSADTIL